MSPVLYEWFKPFGVAKIKIKGTPKFPFSEEDTAFLNRVWETYGDKTDNALEAFCKVAISLMSMRDFYNII